MADLQPGDRVQVTAQGFEQVRGTIIGLTPHRETGRLVLVQVALDQPFPPLGYHWPFLPDDVRRITPEQEDRHDAL